MIGASARSGKGLKELMAAVDHMIHTNRNEESISIKYATPIEEAISILEPEICKHVDQTINTRWLTLKLLDYDEGLQRSLIHYLGYDLLEKESVQEKRQQAISHLQKRGISTESLLDQIVASSVLTAEKVCHGIIHYDTDLYQERDRKIDRILTSKWTGIPIMIALLALIFWITISGANIPSQFLSDGLFWVEDRLADAFLWLHSPQWLCDMLVHGVYRTLAWVVSVMLPPMAIFFPLFTLLEDLGYLPRIAFNLDRYFKKCHACGKQALTMCMGFGCNAAGIVGCRIIDSPRERLIAMITNSFVPCNGRFPTLIAIITMFFAGSFAGPLQSIASTLLLTAVILLGVLMTFLVSRLLSKTILKGVPSSFTLELPPYRRPQVGKVIIRSLFDRTLFVLGRAASVAAPAGLILWLLANITVGDMTLLAHCSEFLDPFAHLLGMDGVILLAFILGFPANEIVVPIIIMAYMASGTLIDLTNLSTLKQLLVDNGWTWITAVSTMLFSLMHWPCSTTCLTIKKESNSLKWTAVSILVPTGMGMLVCFLFTTIANLLV